METEAFDYEVVYDESSEQVYAKARGQLNYMNAVRIMREAVRVGRQCECNRFIIDVRDTIVDESLISVHNLMADPQYLHINNENDRVAIIYADKHTYLKSIPKPKATSFFNYFRKPDRAFHWLRMPVAV